MRALITGATGFIGSHLAEALHQKGISLRCLIRKTSKTVWIKHLPVEYIYGDISDYESVKIAARGVDHIYHVAGLTKAKTSAEYFKANHAATRILLKAALEVNPSLKRFIHISSQAAVGPGEPGNPVDEQTPFHPITAYGMSKMESERECLRVMDRLPVTIIRPPAVYGPRDRDVFEFFHTLNMGLQPLIGFNEKHVSLVYIHDLIDGIVLAAEHPKGNGQTYFISSERFYSWKEIGDLTARIMNKRPLRLHIPEFGVYAVSAFAEAFALFSKKPALLNFEKARDIVQDAWTCSVAKAKAEIGYREQVSLEKGISETVAWYKKNSWL